MKRREFITLLGGATAWPRCGWAQQTFPILGYLHQGSDNQPEPVATAFHKGLKQSGYVEGQNLIVEYRWAEGRYDQLSQLAADLVRRKVSVIASAYAVAALAAKAATSTIPIIFVTGTDPIRDGLVPALNRPNGNVTGVTFFAVLIAAKRLALLHDLLPTARFFALLNNPANRIVSENYLKDSQEAARKIGLEIVNVPASSEHEIDSAFRTMVEHRIEGLIVVPEAFLNSRTDQIVALAARHAVPTMYPWREDAIAGGLVSYATDVADAFHEWGIYVGRVLKGERIANLPVVQSTRFRLVLNLKTAKALGLTIPPDVLSIADEVIE